MNTDLQYIACETYMYVFVCAWLDFDYIIVLAGLCITFIQIFEIVFNSTIGVILWMPSACEVNLMDMGKIEFNQTTTEDKNKKSF